MANINMKKTLLAAIIDAAAIGSGSAGASCGTITITSSVDKITVTKGTNATNYIGAGNSGSKCGEITYTDAESKIYKKDGDTETLLYTK